MSLEVAPGEALGLVGESGCGKSSVALAVLRLLPEGTDVEGRVVAGGIDVTAAPPAALRRLRGETVGLVFQDPGTRLDPLQRIGDHLTETLLAHRPEVGAGEARRLVVRALGAVGIPPGRARQYPHELSGGMRQRVMIALAVLLEPAAVVADEPTTSLDVLLEAQVLDLLDELRGRLGTALLLVTHDLAVVAERCGRVAVMYGGRLVEVGPAGEVLATPRHPYTRALVRAMVSMDTPALSPPPLPVRRPVPPGACVYAPHCPEAVDLCLERAPELEAAGPTLVACHLATSTTRPWGGAGGEGGEDGRGRTDGSDGDDAPVPGPAR